MLRIQRITEWSDLLPLRQQWDMLAGDCVFRSWVWQSTWWQHYGTDALHEGGRELFVLAAFDEDTLLAILPCYVETHFARGRVLRLLGDGEVCSDHLDVLCASANLETAIPELAKYICHTAADWDTTDFVAVGEAPGLAALRQSMEQLGCAVTLSANESVWSVPLPKDWESFLAIQSKSHRKQLRRAEKRGLDAEHAAWRLVKTPEEFDVAWPILIDLHQRRRNSLGEPGCFASDRWAAFHADVARQLLAVGQLRFSWLELDGQPVAAEYHFAGEQITWAYQGGVDPDRLNDEPGRMSMIRAVQHAIAEGHRQFDLLRGDEPYKPHWRAQPRATFDVQIVPPRSSAVLRSRACNALDGAARVARKFTNRLH